MGKISAGAAGQHKAGGAVALCDLWHHGICHRSDFVGLPAGAEYADAGNPERFIDDGGAECLFCRGDDSGGVQVGRPKGTADFYAGPGRVVRTVCGRGLYPQPSGQRGGNRILLQDGAVGYCRFVPASGFGSAAVDSPLGQDCQQKGVVKISREILDSSSHRMTAAEAAAR